MRPTFPPVYLISETHERKGDPMRNENKSIIVMIIITILVAVAVTVFFGPGALAAANTADTVAATVCAAAIALGGLLLTAEGISTLRSGRR